MCFWFHLTRLCWRTVDIGSNQHESSTKSQCFSLNHAFESSWFEPRQLENRGTFALNWSTTASSYGLGGSVRVAWIHLDLLMLYYCDLVLIIGKIILLYWTQSSAPRPPPPSWLMVHPGSASHCLGKYHKQATGAFLSTGATLSVSWRVIATATGTFDAPSWTSTVPCCLSPEARSRPSSRRLFWDLLQLDRFEEPCLIWSWCCWSSCSCCVWWWLSGASWRTRGSCRTWW